MNPAVLSVGIGKWYPRGVARLIKMLYRTGTVCDALTWCNTYPGGSTYHDVCPYTFKPKAFRYAQRRGYKIAVWMDAAVFPVKNLAPLFAKLQEQTIVALANDPWKMGQWCSDEALRALDLTREQSLVIPEITTCMLGLNLKRPNAQYFLDEWERLSPVFRGAWANDIALDELKKLGLPFRTVGHISNDPRVLGHRHDQTVASAILNKMGVQGLPMKPWLSYDPDATDVLAINRGGPDVDKVL